MTITLVGTEDVFNGTNPDTWTHTLPTGHAEDDVAYVIVISDQGLVTLSVDTPGWTELTQQSDTGGRDRTVAVFRRVLTSGSETNPTLRETGDNEETNSVLFVVRGADPTTPEDITVAVVFDDATGGDTGSYTRAHEPFTTVTDNAAAFLHHGIFDAEGVGSLVIPSGQDWTELAQDTTDSYGSWIIAYDLDVGIAGTVTPNPWNHTFVVDNTKDVIRTTVVVRPAASGGPISLAATASAELTATANATRSTALAATATAELTATAAAARSTALAATATAELTAAASATTATTVDLAATATAELTATASATRSLALTATGSAELTATAAATRSTALAAQASAELTATASATTGIPLAATASAELTTTAAATRAAALTATGNAELTATTNASRSVALAATATAELTATAAATTATLLTATATAELTTAASAARSLALTATGTAELTTTTAATRAVALLATATAELTTTVNVTSDADITLHVTHTATLAPPRHTATLAPPRHTARLG